MADLTDLVVIIISYHLVQYQFGIYLKEQVRNFTTKILEGFEKYLAG